MTRFCAIDLFSGCGGLSQGLKRAGFDVLAAFDNDPDSVTAYRLNHKDTKVYDSDIRDVDISTVRTLLKGRPLHLLAGCPPCQGFSSVRRLNKKRSKRDDRNGLILEYLRFVKGLSPLTIMMENVPGLVNYGRFKYVVRELERMGYNPKYEVVDIHKYGVPQRRRRLVLVGSLLGDLDIAGPTGKTRTVRDAIGHLEAVSRTKDPVHRIVAGHTREVLERIKATPHNGGSRKDVGYKLNCHKSKGVGFHDVYGRLRWDEPSSTITGGCLKPSKGRFLHPVKDRAITAREAALLQSFPRGYKFPLNISQDSISLMIGNALPPKFSYIQSVRILKHIRAAESGD
jgi:DNA (cytosine-5)-methyltransferase 1